MLKVVEKTASILRKQSVDGFDIYCTESVGFTVEVRNSSVETIKTAHTVGLAVRVLVDGRLGFAYTTDTSDDSVAVTIECAKENARTGVRDEYSFSTPSSSYFTLRYDESYPEIPPERKVELALELESKAKGIDPRIKKVRKATYADSLAGVYYLNSNDNAFSYTTSNFSLSILLVAEDGGDSETGWDWDSRRFFSELNPDLVAHRSAESALQRLWARPMSTTTIPVIFKNVVFAEILSAISTAFTGENIVRRKSIFADKLGSKVASQHLCVYDDPFQLNGTRSAPFDDEGTVTRKKAVIERGILKNFLLDIYSAKKLGMEPTGNGIKPAVSRPPRSGATNLKVEEGKLELEELLRLPEEVLLVTDAMGVHTVNPITGEVSIGVSGVYYRNGEAVQPVRGMTVAGSVLDMFKNVAEVGRDSRWLGSVCSPSILVEYMTVGGK